MRKLKALAVLALLCVGTGSWADVILSASNNTFGAFDANRGNRSLFIGSNGTVVDVDIRIDFAKCDDPAMQPGQTVCPVAGEEFASEIFFYLTSPAGTRVDLVYTHSSQPEGIEQGSTKPAGTYPTASNVGSRVDVTYDDEAANPAGPIMLSGTFRPEELLALFDGENSIGTWVLTVGDSVGLDPLSFFSATLTVTVPEPGSLALLGIALAGLGVMRRRNA